MAKISTASLYLVPTPIGNLEDITLRALKILKQADVILAEDTRKSSILLKHYEISVPMQRFHSHNEHKAVSSIIRKLKNGVVMALITDAGTPGISDPGFLLVRECLKNHLKIDCLPGPVAFVPALVKSGLPTDRFVFEAFLPHKKGRLKRIRAFLKEERTIILYESPHRLQKALTQLLEILGPERQASVSRELTKIHEETVNGTLAELDSYYSEKEVKGEIVIVIAGVKQ